MTQDLVITLDYANATKVHPVGLAALLVAVSAVFAVQRRYVPAVFVALAVLIPSAQRVVVAGLDFNFIRILVLGGMFRALVRNDFSGVRWCAVDTLVLFAMVSKLVGAIGRSGFQSEIVTTLGSEFEAVGAYAIFRSCIRSPADLRAIAMAAAITTLVAVPFFLVERATGRNLFSAFGGVPEVTYVREGRLRCQGAIAHAILAGCVFAAFIPIWVGVAAFSRGVGRMISAAGILGALVIIVCCASSTPVAAVGQAMIGWVFFPARTWLRMVWISAIALLVALHMVMKAPVWHLIGRIDLVGGSTGHHRFLLIDAAVNNISEWWLFGLRSTAHWGWGLIDVTNQFILDGIKGGVWATIALLGAMVLCFAYCGRVIRAARRQARLGRGRLRSDWREAELIAYGVGVVIFIHFGIFLAVSYFGQAVMIWQLILASGASIAAWPGLLRARPAAIGARRRAPEPRVAAARPLPHLQGSKSGSTIPPTATDMSSEWSRR